MMKNRWVQLAAGILGMVAVANFQYGWTLFVDPIHQRFLWAKEAIQLAFTLFVLAETWLLPVEAYLVDRFGPRFLLLAGGLLCAIAWLGNASATTLSMFYLNGILAGIGAGIVYGTAIGNALRWFPDRRGLAAGLTAAAFGAGSALTVMPMYRAIQLYGYPTAFALFGTIQGLLVIITAFILRAPQPGEVPQPVRPKVRQSVREATPVEMARAPVFWLMYLMMTMATVGGMMAIAQIAPMADDYKVAKTPVTLLGFTMAALPFAMSLDRVLNGITRPLFGWISDHIGRERTMFVAFGLEGVAIFLLVHLAHKPLLFVLLTGLSFFAWGEIFSLFPALSGDLFGRRFAATNYGLLYTAKGTASLLVPLGSKLQHLTGSWKPIFLMAAAFDWIAAALALFVLGPMCARWLARQAERVAEERAAGIEQNTIAEAVKGAPR
jgi:OFA family oxalate/formate antiporter-like MFS transporter